MSLEVRLDTHCVEIRPGMDFGWWWDVWTPAGHVQGEALSEWGARRKAKRALAQLRSLS